MSAGQTLCVLKRFNALAQFQESLISILSFDTLGQTNLRGFQRKLTVLSAASMFLDGFDITVIGVALPVLVEQWQISSAMQGVVAASTVVGMLLGSLVLGHLTDHVGRRKMYLVNLLCFVVFAVLAAVSQNVWELIVFRFLLGLGLGADYPVASTLLAEFSPTERRGHQMATLVANWFLGSLTAYVMGVIFAPIGPSYWRWILFLGAVFGLIIIGLRSQIPESPRWLRSQGRETEAQEVLAGLSGNSASVEQQSIKLPPSSSHNRTRWLDLFSRTLIRTTVFVCVFWFAYDVAFYGIVAYTPTILGHFTTGSTMSANAGSAVIALLGLLGACIGIFLVDRWGRRPLIILAFAGLTISLVVLALNPTPDFAILVILFALAELFANMGPGVLDMVYPTELYPTRLRSAGTGLATAVSRIGAILGIVVFPQLTDAWGLGPAMWLFVAAGALGLITCVLLAPETRGRSLEKTSGEELPETSTSPSTHSTV